MKDTELAVPQTDATHAQYQLITLEGPFVTPDQPQRHDLLRTWFFLRNWLFVIVIDGDVDNVVICHVIDLLIAFDQLWEIIVQRRFHARRRIALVALEAFGL